MIAEDYTFYQQVINPENQYYHLLFLSLQDNNTPQAIESEIPVGIELCGAIINECDDRRFILKKQHIQNLLRSRGYDLPEECIAQTKHHFLDIHY